MFTVECATASRALGTGWLHSVRRQVDVQKITADFEEAVLERAMQTEREWCVNAAVTQHAILQERTFSRLNEHVICPLSCDFKRL